MKRTKTGISALAAAMALTLSLSACGNGGGTNDTTQASVSASENKSEAEAPATNAPTEETNVTTSSESKQFTTDVKSIYNSSIEPNIDNSISFSAVLHQTIDDVPYDVVLSFDDDIPCDDSVVLNGVEYVLNDFIYNIEYDNREITLGRNTPILFDLKYVGFGYDKPTGVGSNPMFAFEFADEKGNVLYDITDKGNLAYHVKGITSMSRPIDIIISNGENEYTLNYNDQYSNTFINLCRFMGVTNYDDVEIEISSSERYQIFKNEHYTLIIEQMFAGNKIKAITLINNYM